MDFLEITDLQEQRFLETFVTHETKTTNVNLYQGKENEVQKSAKIQPAHHTAVSMYNIIIIK